jgi:hypothetical protein
VSKHLKVSREEFFSTQKSIGITMDKKDYVTIKTYLFNHKISMTKLFKRIASDVASKKPWVQKIIDEMVDEQFQKELARLEASSLVDNAPQIDYSSIDADRLYDLIKKKTAK